MRGNRRGAARRANSLVWLALALVLGGGARASAQPRLQIVGYINVTVGCQSETVQHLKAFAAKHPKDVSLEIVDFGSVGGNARWRADGLHCETILVNGSSQFQVGRGSARRIVVLRMPEGVRWTFSDLDAVLAQELRSPKSSVLSDGEAAKVARQTPVAWRQGTWNGKPVGEVLIGAQTVFRFSAAYEGKKPAERARTASLLLKRLYAGGLSADDVNAAAHPSGGLGAVVARGKEVAVVTGAEAGIIKRTPRQAAAFWAFNLSEALRTLGR